MNLSKSGLVYRVVKYGCLFDDYKIRRNPDICTLSRYFLIGFLWWIPFLIATVSVISIVIGAPFFNLVMWYLTGVMINETVYFAWGLVLSIFFIVASTVIIIENWSNVYSSINTNADKIKPIKEVKEFASAVYTSINDKVCILIKLVN